MSRARRRHHGGHDEEAEGNGERWLLTYADMITLLLALFIVLFAMSTISQKKFVALALGLRQSFNPKPGILPHSDGLLSNPSLQTATGINQVRQQLVNPIVTTTTTAPANIRGASTSTSSAAPRRPGSRASPGSSSRSSRRWRPKACSRRCRRRSPPEAWW